MKMKSAVAILASLGLFAAVSANAEQAPEKLVVKVQQLDVEHGNKDVGTVEITESPYGLVFTPNLNGLAPGLHGFHIHENPSCEPKEKDGKLTAGLAAGGHWNPNNAKGHGFLWFFD